MSFLPFQQQPPLPCGCLRLKLSAMSRTLVQSFLQADKGWIELKDWRASNGLNPLIIGDEIIKTPCPGKGASCSFDVKAGQAIIEQGAGQLDAACPVSSILNSQSTSGGLTMRPCDFAGKGGAAIDLSTDKLTLRPAQMQNGRAWTQPLYAKLPKPPKRKSAPKDQ